MGTKRMTLLLVQQNHEMWLFFLHTEVGLGLASGHLNSLVTTAGTVKYQCFLMC